MNRRDLCIALSSFAALSLSAEAQQPAPAASSASKAETVLDTGRTFAYPQLPVNKGANGESRAVVRGVLPTGEEVEMHETTLLAGHMPHPPHTHRHSEFIMIREGTVQFIDEGKPAGIVGPGGVIYIASNKLHGMKNIGDTTANYFVIAIGRES